MPSLEQSYFWTTNGTGDGTSQYTMQNMEDFIRSIFSSNAPYEGVLDSPASSKLQVLSSANNQITVKQGFGIVYGYFYQNTVDQNFSVPTPGIGTTGYIVVLRASYSTQTVRITLLKSADGTPTIPIPVQTINTTWDVPLANFQITTAGQITNLNDLRRFCHFNTRTSGDQIDVRTIGSTHIGQVGDTYSVGTPNNILLGNIRIISGVVTPSANGAILQITFPTYSFSQTPFVQLTNYGYSNATLFINDVNNQRVTFYYTVPSGETAVINQVSWQAIGQA